MKVKEILEHLQSLDQDLDVYIFNEKESSLFLVEDVHETSDFGENEKGENEWEDFVTIFPATKSQPLFTLSAEKVEIVKHFLSCDKNILGMSLPTWERDLMIMDLENLLNRINQWQNEHNK